MTYIAPRETESTTKSSKNSTKTPLLIGETFTGGWEKVEIPTVMVSMEADTDGFLHVDFSFDGVSISETVTHPYKIGGINPHHIHELGSRWVRVRFENTSGVNQTTLFINSSYGTYNEPTIPINSIVAENHDSTLVRTTDYSYEVAMGKREGRTGVNNYGYNNDVDGTNNTIFEVLAPWGGIFDPTTNIMSIPQTFDISYDSGLDGVGSQGALTLLVSYLDDNLDLQDAVHVLGGTGSDVTAFTGLGINRVLVLSNGGAGFNVADITITATIDTTIQAQIPAERSITQQSIYHIPQNHKLIIDYFKVNCLKIAGGGGSPRVWIRGYSYDRVSGTRYQILSSDIDTDVENTIDFHVPQPVAFNSKYVVYLEASTDTNNTSLNGRFSGILERNA